MNERARSIFCNRTLNLRAIKVIGYDMDYTLVHYHVDVWERRAYEYLRQHFLAEGWPVAELEFDGTLVARGLIIDTERGNILKTNRFGFVKKACHGTRPLEHEQQREIYSREMVDPTENRWAFLYTLFSLSEGCMYAQLVDLLDAKKAPKVVGYAELYAEVRAAIDLAHAEGRLKAEIVAEPERFVDREPETALALLDQYHAGKKLMLITNSEWSYVAPMMSYALDEFLPRGMTWQNLFEIVVVEAKKPRFFTTQDPFFEVMQDSGLLKAGVDRLVPGRVYYGGSARRLEQHLGYSGDEFLYVGDHIFGDVQVTKDILRWRTALILRELEDDVREVEAFHQKELRIIELMREKERLEEDSVRIRLELQRCRKGYGPAPTASPGALEREYAKLRSRIEELDRQLTPLAIESSRLNNPLWGLLMRAGNEKSHLAFQAERFADIYTSRVSNFLEATPYLFARSPRGTAPHDPIDLSGPGVSSDPGDSGGMP